MSEILRPEFPLGSVTYRHVRDGIFIRQDDYYRKCLYTDLLWVEASGSYSDIHLRDRSRIVVALRIGVMGRYLPASHFVRIHRSYVVCRQHVAYRRQVVPDRAFVPPWSSCPAEHSELCLQVSGRRRVMN